MVILTVLDAWCLVFTYTCTGALKYGQVIHGRPETIVFYFRAPVNADDARALRAPCAARDAPRRHVLADRRRAGLEQHLNRIASHRSTV